MINKNIVEFVSEKYPDLKTILDLEKSQIKYPSHIANDRQLNSVVFSSKEIQDLPKKGTLSSDKKGIFGYTNIVDQNSSLQNMYYKTLTYDSI